MGASGEGNEAALGGKERGREGGREGAEFRATTREKREEEAPLLLLLPVSLHESERAAGSAAACDCLSVSLPFSICRGRQRQSRAFPSLVCRRRRRRRYCCCCCCCCCCCRPLSASAFVGCCRCRPPDGRTLLSFRQDAREAVHGVPSGLLCPPAAAACSSHLHFFAMYSLLSAATAAAAAATAAAAVTTAMSPMPSRAVERDRECGALFSCSFVSPVPGADRFLPLLPGGRLDLESHRLQGGEGERRRHSHTAT